MAALHTGRSVGNDTRFRAAGVACDGPAPLALPARRDAAEAAGSPDGLVWVTDKERSVVHRIEPDAGRVLDSFPAGSGAYAIARVGDAMWITSFAGADVRKFVP